MSLQVDTPALISAAEYLRMFEDGTLSESDRVELLDGLLVPKPVASPPHCAIVDRLNALFCRVLAGRCIVRVQSSFLLDDHSVPEPDLNLLRPREDFYFKALPGPGEVLLAIEVASSSERYDLHSKVPRYAARGIPESWVVRVLHGEIRVFRVLVDGIYQEQLTLRHGDRIRPLSFPDVELAVDDLIGPPREEETIYG